MGLFKKIFSKYFGPGSTFYTILKPCRRCVYQKSHEPVLIVSLHRGPRILIKEGKVFLRVGECKGLKECSKCLNAEDVTSLECIWREI